MTGITLLVCAIRLCDRLFVRAWGAGYAVFTWFTTFAFAATNVFHYLSITKFSSSHRKFFLLANAISPVITFCLGLSCGLVINHTDITKLFKNIFAIPDSDPIWDNYPFIWSDRKKFLEWVDNRTVFCGRLIFGFIDYWSLVELVFVIWMNFCKVPDYQDRELI